MKGTKTIRIRKGFLSLLLSLIFALAVTVPAFAKTAETTDTLANHFYKVTAGEEELGTFYFKASDLSEYILYDSDKQYLGVKAGAVLRTTTLDDNVRWKVAAAKGTNAFTLQSYTTGKYLCLAKGKPVLRASSDKATAFIMTRTTGTVKFPEISTNVKIQDKNGNTVSRAEAMSRPKVGDTVIGWADTHAHLYHYLASGEVVFADSMFSPLGVTDALKDCSNVHGVNGAYDVWGLAVDGSVGHKTAGYPDFSYWPTAYSTGHQQTYYKWLERAYLSGQRVFVNMCVNNRILGEITNLLPPYKNGTTDDMVAAKKQIAEAYRTQDYIDAQCGGKGKGWFRICTSASQARQVISEGKMAVFLGMELDQVYGVTEDYIGEYKEGKITKAQCEGALEKLDKTLDEYYKLGIRSFFPIHAVDNGFGGCQLYQGEIFSILNLLATGGFYVPEDSQNNRVYYKQLSNNLTREANGDGNTKGLTETGEWLIHKMIDKKYIIEIDHMSDKSFNKVLDICWDEKYPGLIASHTRILDMFQPEDEAWEQIDIPRMIKLYQLGGFVSMMMIETVNGQQICVADYLQQMINLSAKNKGKAATYKTYNKKAYQRYGGPYAVPTTWYNTNSDPSDDLILGIGLSSDVNGACMLPNFDDNSGGNVQGIYDEVNYKDGSFGSLYDGVYSAAVKTVQFNKQKSGNRYFNINGSRGVAHYGLVPDMIKRLESRPDRVNIDATFHSAEGYLRMLERVEKYSATYPARDSKYWVEVPTEYWHGNY